MKVNSYDVYGDLNLAYQQDSNHANNNSSPQWFQYMPTKLNLGNIALEIY